MRDAEEIPKILAEALADGTWKDLGPETLRGLLRPVPDLPELELFADKHTMSSVWHQVEVGDFVDEPEYCMVRDRTSLHVADVRLVLQDAVFVGGSIMPGDDVLLALDLRSGADDPVLYVFDWTQPIPRRWVAWGRLSAFLNVVRTSRR